MDYQIIALDLDGTLLNDRKEISSRTKSSVTEALRSGRKVILASARPPFGMMPYARELGLTEYGGYLLCFNGGMITEVKTGDIIYRRPIPQEYNAPLAATALEENVSLMVYGERGDCIYTDSPDDEGIRHVARNNRMEIHVRDMLHDIGYPAQKFLMLAEAGHLAGVEERMKKTWEGKLGIFRSEPFILEIVPAGIDKAVSLQYLLDHLGLSREQLIACGDGFNDAGMLAFAGLGVAMENAVAPTREAADYVTASNNDDGVALVVEKFMLNHGL